MKLIKAALGYLLFIIVSVNYGYSQYTLSGWQTCSSILSTNKVSVDSRGRIWAATNGGVYNYDTATKIINEYRNINAMLSIAATAICCDTADKKVYIGCFDGTLEIVDEDGRTWEHNLSVKSDKNITNPIINDIVIQDSHVYIAGGFGLAIYNKSKKVFDDSPPKLGNFQSNTNTRKILLTDKEIWLATEKGVARARKDSVFVPSWWTTYTTKNGLTDNDIYSITGYQGKILTANKNSISMLENDSFRLYSDYQYFTGFQGIGDSLFLSSMFGLSVNGMNILTNTISPFISGFEIFGTSQNPMIIIMFDNNGLGIFDNNGLKLIKYNSPKSNQFTSLDLDNDGNLWAATASSPGDGKGVMEFTNGKWINFYYPEDSLIKTNSYFKIKSHPNGSILASAWGGGFMKIIPSAEGYGITKYDHTNSPIDSVFPVLGESITDLYGNIWIINWGGYSPGKLLISYDKNGNMRTFENLNNRNDRNYIEIAVDNNNTFFLGSSVLTSATGMYYFNYGGTPDDPSDDIYGTLTTNTDPALIDNLQSALAIDRLGMLWIGTPSGLQIITNPSSLLNGTRTYIIEKKKFKGKSILAILVDALNNKWIATTEGLYVTDPDGEIQNYFNTDNSPIPSNEIFSLAVNPTTGIIYIGTRQGLSIAQTESIDPLDNYDIYCYPQPFSPRHDNELIIEGLSTDSDIRITTINGELIKNLTTHSRRVIWDGRNTSGEIVDTGIYLIIATSQSSSNSQIAKIAVIHR